MVTEKQLEAIFGTVAYSWAAPLNSAMAKYQISNQANRIIDFLAQVGWESNGFKAVEENLNYSEKGLRIYFKSKFKENEFAQYARHPEMIGNRVYGNRMGNGPESSGEGFKYRGRGLIQLTGKDNYMAASLALSVNLTANPDLVKQPAMAAITAAWYWYTHNCNVLSDRGDFQRITRVINGGLNGYNERVALRNKIISVIGG